jgi:hypothetical protein
MATLERSRSAEKRSRSATHPGTDQLSTRQHDQFGHVEATPALQLAYEPGLGMTSEVTLAASDNAGLFGYRGKGQRVLKQVVHQGQVVSSKLYVHGTHALPFLEMHQDGTATAYIHGPDGLITTRADALYFVLKDHEGFVRHILDSTGSLAAGYAYLPFGGLARNYGAKPTRSSMPRPGGSPLVLGPLSAPVRTL